MKSNKALKLILVFTLFSVVFLVAAKNQGWISHNPAKKVTTERVQKRAITQVISGNGKAYPVLEMKISPEISGEVIALYVKEGDKVKEGDLLLKLRPDAYQAARQRASAEANTAGTELAEARARLAQAKARLVNRQSDLKRSETLYRQQVIAPAEWEEAQAGYAVAKAGVKAAEETMRSAQYNVQRAEAALRETVNTLKRAVITAPAGGTVSAVNVRVGERVLGTSFMAGTELLRISDLDRMEVRLDVNESDIVNISLSDSVDVGLSAYPETVFKGVVTAVANTARVSGLTEQLTNFEIKIAFLPAAYDLAMQGGAPFKAGMSATVNIKARQAGSALCIPKEAITMQEGAESAVFIFDKGVAKIAAIKKGIEDEEYVQVLSGLSEKQEIITGPAAFLSRLLKEGDRVEREKEL